MKDYLGELSYDHLKTICVLIDKRSTAVAASELGCSTRKVRERVKYVEKQLGYQLFDLRRGRKVVPLRRAHHVRPEFHAAINAIENIFSTPQLSKDSEYVAIGVTGMLEFVSSYVLEGGLRDSFPNVNFQNSSLSKNQLSSRGQDMQEAVKFIDSGELDIVVFYEINATPEMTRLHNPRVSDDDYDVITVFKEQNVCVVHPEAEVSDPITMEQYLKLSHSALDRRLVAIFSNGKARPPKWEMYTLEASMALISHYKDYTSMPPALPAKIIAQSIPVRIVQPSKEMHLPEWHLKVLTKKKESLTPLLVRVRDALVKGFRDLRQNLS